MQQVSIKKNIELLKKLSLDMYEKDFLLTWEKSFDEVQATILVAEALKEMHRTNISTRIFDSGLGISIFKDNSTRTKFSFASAVNALGLAVQDFDEKKSQIAHGETVRETANMVSFTADVIGIRDDMYLGEGDRYQREVSEAVQYGYDKGILHQRPTLVNLQSDIDHPTQSMSDLAKLKDYFGGFENLKGKKIAMTWAYSPSYGKPLSVPQGVIGLMSRFGMDVTLAYPEGYDLIPEVVEVAKKNAAASGGKFEIVHSMDEAFKDAHVVYPKSWAPYWVMQKRTDLLRSGDHKGLEELEKQALANNAKHTDWECTEENMKLTQNGAALYQHCLPADITGLSCKQGEVVRSVFDRYIPDTYHQASFKPFVIMAMILLGKVSNPAQKLEELITKGIKRQY
ncbi:knotted carbamoyltransferase YgeW [bacterium]|nr:knotted carbamoyltransferase YgeW [bacterium]